MLHGLTLPRFLLLAALLVSCDVDRPLLERHEQGQWKPAAFEVTSMGGQRAAASVTFVLRLTHADGRRLTVEGAVEIDPQAKLIQGSWVEEQGATTRSGVVSSAVVDFFGGQGNRPSLGGQFTLSSDAGPAYRINLPPTRLSTAR